jgi:hypothetical protein
VTTPVTGPRLLVLCEYLSSFVDEPVWERLECWELDGPRYGLGVREFVSPDGVGDEAWASAEAADVDALWPLLEEWAVTRRIGLRIVAEARSALQRAYPHRTRKSGDDRRRAAGHSAAGDLPPVPHATSTGRAMVVGSDPPRRGGA